MNESKGMIAVTGAAGFIGSAVVWALNVRKQENILVIDHLDEDERWRNLVPLHYADYLDRDDFLAKLEGGELDGALAGIIHLGACSSTTEADAGYLMRNNFEYTKRLALWATAAGVRFVYASSAATYGDGALGFDDAHEGLARLRPLNMYGYSKHLFDLWALRHGLLNQIAGLKYFNVYGPNEYHKAHMRSVALAAFEQARATGRVRLFKSHRDDYAHGRQLRDFVYVKDAVDATLALYDNAQANGIFNVGTGQARTFENLACAVFAALEMPPNIEFVDMPEHLRANYQYFTQAETGKLGRFYQPRWSLEAGVRDYVQRYLVSGKRLDPDHTD